MPRHWPSAQASSCGSSLRPRSQGAKAIIVSDPFNDENGLMRASGMPAELLLPWRTTAAMLGGAEYLGQMQLPGGSENRIFLRPDGQVVMVVWNPSRPGKCCISARTCSRSTSTDAASRRRRNARTNHRGRSYAVVRARIARSHHALADGCELRTQPGAQHLREAASAIRCDSKTFFRKASADR